MKFGKAKQTKINEYKEDKREQKHLYVIDSEINIGNGKVRTDCENKFS